jgi:hypothetical protein
MPWRLHDPWRGPVLSVFRNLPKLGLFSIGDGRLVTTSEICGDAEDAFVDHRRHRVRCGHGFVEVFGSRKGRVNVACAPRRSSARELRSPLRNATGIWRSTCCRGTRLPSGCCAPAVFATAAPASGSRARMMDIKDGAERCYRCIDDLFAIVDKIALALATEMQVKLTQSKQAWLGNTTIDQGRGLYPLDRVPLRVGFL